MFFLASSHTKNSQSEKTNKHTIWLIYLKKRFEHNNYSIRTQKKSINIILFYVSVCGVIIYFTKKVVKIMNYRNLLN